MFNTQFQFDGQGEGPQLDLFESIATDIQNKGYSITSNGLPLALTEALWDQLQSMSAQQFERAGIGRVEAYALNAFVRTDEICWITGASRAGQQWLDWMAELQQYLNRRLLLGLFSFESHFAHYGPGDFYKRHVDAFKGEANRILTVVMYLNPGWQPEDGGELVLYTDDVEQGSIRVTPAFGTLVVFLSEDFPHEVLPAKRDRYSIAGWFRLNTSTSDRIDPPM